MTKIIMHGCNGKMGRMISGLAEAGEDVQIVAGIDTTENAGCGYPVFKSLKDCDIEADAVIDFSTASVVDGLLADCVEKKLPLVLCTTGLSGETLDHVGRAAEQIPILRSANMSLGINLLLKLLKEAAVALNRAGFDIEIVEKHHNQKLDAPSGTAIALADSMNEALDQAFTYQYDRSAVRQKRNPKEIGIVAVRGGTIVGEHDVIFAGTEEVLTFSHAAGSRAVFGKGALEAAKYLKGKPAGLYNMQDVLQ